MPSNTGNYMGLALPAEGPGEWTARAAGDEIILNMHASQSDNPFQIKNSAGTVLFAITLRGNLFPRVYTTAPTTGLTKGEWLNMQAGTVPKIGIVYSSANGIKYIKSRSKSLATATA